MFNFDFKFMLCVALLTGAKATGQAPDTLLPLHGAAAPPNFEEIWGEFNPRAEPLDVETLHEWEEDGVVLRVSRYRIGVLKG